MYQPVEIKNVLRIKKIYTAFKARYDSNYYFAGEYHDFWEFVMVTDGEIGVTAGSDVMVLKKGQAILHEPMEFHRLWSEGSTCPEIVIFSFAADNMPATSTEIFEISDITMPGKVLEALEEAFEVDDVLVKTVKKDAKLNYQIAVKKLEMFLIDTVSQKLKANAGIKSRMAKNYHSIVRVLESNIYKNLSVSDIAKMCNMSEINIKKTFSKYAGMGVMKYFNNIKIKVAESMLKEGFTVKETAEKLGFSNQNYFSTVFKKITGKSPSECR